MISPPVIVTGTHHQFSTARKLKDRGDRATYPNEGRAHDGIDSIAFAEYDSPDCKLAGRHEQDEFKDRSCRNALHPTREP